MKYVRIGPYYFAGNPEKNKKKSKEVRMKQYKIKTDLTTVVEANDEAEAVEKFWEKLEDDNNVENTTTENRLEENMVIKEVKE